MPSPLINRLVDELGYPRLDQNSFDDFIKSAPFSVLFFTEEPKRFPESNDVAVILPELVKNFPQLTPAVISTDAEKALQGRYNFTVWPALVFLKEGRYLGTITKVQNWDVYMAEIGSILALEPRRDPGIGIPVVVNPVASSCGQ
ncbi:hydrogenase-1 expression HyaE [Pontibacterium sp. N1Y112]|uniref:Hydrogenase expression/formation protein n=1 Tax=Pontibacterium sinense TaxID=2781979 RepID=A0A8J7FC56_9GAMM|nr:hydrogenase-1 expression HyaE [Pontibacterium sinense]MBE9397372.1 hydrogenase-1 expression HyaE [Pontibacterium sinense]